MFLPVSTWTPRERRLGLGLAVLLAANVAVLVSMRAPHGERGEHGSPWRTRPTQLDFWRDAKYVDLTHAIRPGMPLWPAFAQPSAGAAKAGTSVDGFITAGEEFTYATHGFVATATGLTTDQLGTQLDPPAHWNELGATISDVPPRP